MASEAVASNAGDLSSPNTSQVKLVLTTREADISLPENSGPILVNTSIELPERVTNSHMRC